MHEVTFSSVVLHRMQRAISNLGLDAETILTRSRYGSALELQSSGARVTHNATAQLWHELEKESGDPIIGLHTGETFDYETPLALEYLFLSSPTFGDALAAAQPYSRLISDALVTRVEQEDDKVSMIFELSHDSPLAKRHLTEMTGAAFLHFYRKVTNDRFRPLLVGFTHTAPDNISEFRRIFDCDILFGQADNRITFSQDLLDIPCPLPEPNIAQANVEIIDRQMLALENQDFLRQVTEVIGMLLVDGEVGLEAVAAVIGIKPGRLRYLLSEQGTSFSELLTDYRCNLAKRLLSETDNSIDEIIYLTGFSEPSPFYRAYKRWTGMTPVAYREQHRCEPPPADTDLVLESTQNMY